MRQIVLWMGLALSLGCSKTLQLNLIINDPCNQVVLGSQGVNAQHLELSVSSPELSEPEGTIWSQGDRQGELQGLSPVSDAVVSVSARAANAAGDPAETLAATTVGLVDLTAGDGDVTNLNVVLGRVGWFMNTTDADAASNGNAVCTGLGAKRRGHSASLLPDGRVLVAGGSSVATDKETFWETTEFYEPETGLFVRGPSMAMVRKDHTATVLLDGRVLLAGGLGILNEGTVTTLRVGVVYDPATDTFSGPLRMDQSRAHHTATLLADGRVLLAGGTGDSNVLASTEIFDPTTQTFCAGPSLEPQLRAYHAAVRVGGQQVALIGGRGTGQVLSSVQFVTVAGCGAGSVTAGPSLTKARSHLSAALIPGRNAVAVLGGFEAAATSTENGKGSDAVEFIKLNTQTLGSSTTVCGTLRLRNPRGVAALAPVPGALLILGGLNAQGEALGSAELLRVGDVDSCDVGFELTAGPLTKARAQAEATVLLGGDILVTGGFENPNGVISSLSPGEIFIRDR